MQGHLSCFYADNYYQLCQRHPEVPRLTSTQLAAFAEFNRPASLDELRMDMKLQPGDIQLLHNHSIVHCRSGFTDYEMSHAGQLGPMTTNDSAGRGGLVHVHAPCMLTYASNEFFASCFIVSCLLCVWSTMPLYA